MLDHAYLSSQAIMLLIQCPALVDAARVTVQIAGSAASISSASVDLDLDDAPLCSTGGLNVTSQSITASISAAGPSLVWPSSPPELIVFCQKVNVWYIRELQQANMLQDAFGCRARPWALIDSACSNLKYA